MTFSSGSSHFGNLSSPLAKPAVALVTTFRVVTLLGTADCMHLGNAISSFTNGSLLLAAATAALFSVVLSLPSLMRLSTLGIACWSVTASVLIYWLAFSMMMLEIREYGMGLSAMAIYGLVLVLVSVLAWAFVKFRYFV